MISVVVSVRLSELENVIERGLNTFVEVGQALLEIRDSRLYRDEYSTFEDYCRQRWGFTRMRATQLIGAAEVVQNVNNCLQIPVNESQARPLVGLSPETQAQVWQEAISTAPNGKITAAHVQEVAEKITHPENIHISDDSYEWYTPTEYIESARLVMGGIDLDPASCKEANEIVQADEYYTKKDDGLSQHWFGRVWLNPPYNMPEIENFTTQAHSFYQNKNIDEAIVLVNNATDTFWFHTLLENYPVCFTRGRVKYWGPNVSTGGPRQGQAIFYLGKNVKKFIKEFSKFGNVVGKL